MTKWKKVWPEPFMKKLSKAGPLPDFCLTVHYRICFNSKSVSVCPSLQETLKDYELLSHYCNVCQIWKVIQHGTSSKAWGDTGAQLHTSMLLTVSLLGRLAEIESCNGCHLWILRRHFLQHHKITKRPKSLRKCQGKYWWQRKVSSCVSLESFLKVCCLQYVKINTGNEWTNESMARWVLLFPLFSEWKQLLYLFSSWEVKLNCLGTWWPTVLESY